MNCGLHTPTSVKGRGVSTAPKGLYTLQLRSGQGKNKQVFEAHVCRQLP